MALSDISLTSGMRSNLLSLQNTVSLLNRTQNRLATGKKVNTAIDNPVNFFASQSLNSRASKIDSLKDAMGQAISTITAADKGITAITSMIEQAKGIGQSALSASNGGALGVSFSLADNTETEFVAGTASVTLASVTSGQTIKLTDADGNVTTLTAGTAAEAAADTSGLTFDVETGDDDADAANLQTALNGLNGYTAAVAGAVVTISRTDETVAVGDITGTAVTAGTATRATVVAETAGDTVTLTDEAGTVTTLTAGLEFDVGASKQATALNLINAINALTATTGYSAEIDANDDTKVNIAKDGENITAASVTGTVITGAHASVAEVATGVATELSNLQDEYNQLRSQIDALAGDSGYKGKNLLNNNALDVKFEGTTLTMQGFDASTGTSGLNVGAAAWATAGTATQITNAISTSLDELDSASDTLSQQASALSSNLSIITVRQDFSTNMINTLTEGSDKLTLADTNEEGANMLMLQTRQSLSTTALSLSAQAAQSVLRLFG